MRSPRPKVNLMSKLTVNISRLIFCPSNPQKRLLNSAIYQANHFSHRIMFLSRKYLLQGR